MWTRFCPNWNPAICCSIETDGNYGTVPGRTGKSGIRCNPVIAVKKLQIGAARLVNGEIPAVRHAGIFFVDDFDARICGGVGIADVAGAVGASVVD